MCQGWGITQIKLDGVGGVEKEVVALHTLEESALIVYSLICTRCIINHSDVCLIHFLSGQNRVRKGK